MDPESIRAMEEFETSRTPHWTMYYSSCEFNIFVGDLKEYEIGVDLGKPWKLEGLSDMTGDVGCAINGQFFAGKTEGLGTLITKTLLFCT